VPQTVPPATKEVSLQKYQMYIDGEWVDASSGRYFESDNPYLGKAWALVPRGSADDVDRAVRAAHKAFTSGPWPRLTASGRGALLRRLGDLVAEHSKHLAELEVRDNGKLFVEMTGMTAYMAEWYRYYGGLADKIEGAVIPIDKPDTFNYTRYEPLGVVAAIIPWNSPLFLTAWKLAPALAAGNTVVIKPSEYTSTSVLEFMKLVEQAGFPPGVVNVVTGFGQDVGMPLVEHPLVAKVAFTGSDVTGQRIYEAAARQMKPVTMELGGKSPNIVFDDADLDNAVKGAISGIFAATGQTCVAGSRLLVQESIHDRFLEKLLAFARTAKMGNPMSPDTQIGPVTNQPQLEKVMKYIGVAKEENARLVLGGARGSRPECGTGWFVEPTIFDRVTNDMRIAQEEVFGPVLAVIPFKDDEEAVTIGNDVVYGLAAGVWTQNIRRALMMAERLKAGTVWINTYRSVSYMSPFGGYKRSGLGRENGQEMIKQYLQTKSVWISTATEVPNPFVQR
jgi:(Z)-2-((N-methylformamido)methylene)-5-hydroxybutyrolactone dehydrogenase